MINKILSVCRDSDRKKLPEGVTPEHIYQVKMNSYTNTARDSVTMDIYFKGFKGIANAKYYSIQNLTIKQFMELYNVIFDEQESALEDLFEWDIGEED